mgnify:CR=1 FL=1
MKCKQCGKELNPGAKFCTACGARVEDVDEQLQAEAEEVELDVVEDNAVAEVSKDAGETETHNGDDDTATDDVETIETEVLDKGVDAEETTVLPEDPFEIMPTEPVAAPADQTVAMPKASGPVDTSDGAADSAGGASGGKVKSRRGALIAGAAAAVVAVGAIGTFVLSRGGSGDSSEPDESVEKSSAKASSQKGMIIKEKQVKTDLTAVNQLSSGFVPESKFVDGGSYSVKSVDVTSQKKDAEGNVTVKATAVTRNNAFETKAKLTGTYTKKGKKYTPSWKVDSSTTKAIAPIEKDPSGLWTKGDVTFDKKNQTSTVKADYEPLWFETVDGDVEYTYKFDGTKWALDGDKAPTVSYENLVSDKYTDTSDRGRKALVENFAITSADDGKLAFNFKWTQLIESHISNLTAQVSTDVSGQAPIVPLVMDDGSRRIVAKTYIEKDSEADGKKDTFAVSIMAKGPDEYEDASKHDIVVGVTGKMTNKDGDGAITGTWAQTFRSTFEIPQEQTPTKSE